jgi:hypothetical protein
MSKILKENLFYVIMSTCPVDSRQYRYLYHLFIYSLLIYLFIGGFNKAAMYMFGETVTPFREHGRNYTSKNRQIHESNLCS